MFTGNIIAGNRQRQLLGRDLSQSGPRWDGVPADPGHGTSWTHLRVPGSPQFSGPHTLQPLAPQRAVCSQSPRPSGAVHQGLHPGTWLGPGQSGACLVFLETLWGGSMGGPVSESPGWDEWGTPDCSWNRGCTENRKGPEAGLQKYAQWSLSTTANMAALTICLHGGYCWHCYFREGKPRPWTRCWLSQVSGGMTSMLWSVRSSLHRLPELGERGGRGRLEGTSEGQKQISGMSEPRDGGHP